MILPSMRRVEWVIRGSTPFPNALIDQAMPLLSDTAWRILCIVVRQTNGWHDGPGRRRSADWLSHSQLKRRSGRQGAAVSRAIDALCKLRLIAVRDGSGRLLNSAPERRRSRTALFYSLCSEKRIEQRNEQNRTSKTEDNKTNPDKRKQTRERSE